MTVPRAFRLQRLLPLLRRPDVKADGTMTSVEALHFGRSEMISQAPRRKSMLLLMIRQHVKLWRLLRRPDVTLCGFFGCIGVLSCSDYSGAQT
jgi:hypothetical protein